MVKQAAILLGVLLVSLNICTALTIDNYAADIHLAYGKAIVETELTFPVPVSGRLILPLPSDAEKIALYVDKEQQKPRRNEQGLAVSLNKSRIVQFNYISNGLLDRTTLLATLRMPTNVSNAVVTVTLPEKAVLVRPLSSKNVEQGSIFPKPTRATTDGKSFIFVWEEQHLQKGDEIALFVDYGYPLPVSWIIGIIGILMAGVVMGWKGWFFWKKRKEERKEKPAPKKQKRYPTAKRAEKNETKNETAPAALQPETRPSQSLAVVALPIEGYLKEDEEQVVTILKQREGSCEQGTLRVITGFSKAKLSVLLKELEERNVIFKEKRGKKNLVFLRQQQMNNSEPSRQ